MITTGSRLRVLRVFAELVRRRRYRWVESIHDGRMPARYDIWDSRTQGDYDALMAGVDALVAVSPELADFYVRIGVPAARVVTIGPLLGGFDRPDPESLPPGVRAFLDEHDPVWLAVGVMVPHCDYATIVEAFSRFRVRSARAGLLLATSNVNPDRAYERMVSAALSGLAGDAIVAKDLEHGQMLASMVASDVVIRGHQAESYGLSRVEAMVLGTPVVATPTGETSFVFTYSFGDSTSLLQAVEEALDAEPDHLLGAHAHFAGLAASNLDELLAVYRNLMDD
jgi:glycosyltransferase involved in cell wall biosynthesis